MKYEPVAIGTAIIGLVMAALVWLQSMGWLTWSPEQMTNFETFLSMLVPIIVSLIGGYLIRKKTISKQYAQEKGWTEDGS